MNKFNLRCPQCRKDVKYEGNRYFPFCSDRCQMIDLGVWLEGKYVIKGMESDTETPRETSEGHISQTKKGEE